MIEAFLFGIGLLVCAAMGLSAAVAGIMMTTLDARLYAARRRADMEIVTVGQRVAGDVLLTSFGLTLVATGTADLLAMIGVL